MRGQRSNFGGTVNFFNFTSPYLQSYFLYRNEIFTSMFSDLEIILKNVFVLDVIPSRMTCFFFGVLIEYL